MPRWNGTDKAPACRECGEACEMTGRLTWYCPSCDTCEDCGCPRADGFTHSAVCVKLERCECGHELDMHCMGPKGFRYCVASECYDDEHGCKEFHS